MRGSRPGITAVLLCAVAVRAEGAGKEMALTRGSGLAARGRRRGESGPSGAWASGGRSAGSRAWAELARRAALG